MRLPTAFFGKVFARLALLVVASSIQIVWSGGVVALAAADDNGSGGAAWERVDDDGFATIESRPVADAKVREVRITATLKQPAPRLMALIGDVTHYPSFMPPTEETRAITTQGRRGLFYIVIDPPLIHRRDYCVNIEVVKLSDGRLQSRFHRAVDGCPAEKPGLVRMTRIEGSWTLTPLPDGTTRVQYQAITDPAGTVPTWMVNRAAGGQVRDMFHSMEKAVGNPGIGACPESKSLGCGL